MNWSEIYNTARRALFNAGEIVRKSWTLHFDPTPKDIQVSFYDENGNLKTVLMPNVAKWKNRIWSDAQSALEKWNICVHEQEGSDETGDGTLDRPFKTFKKATLSVPNGGLILIKLLSDITLRASEVFSIQNKSIITVCHEQPRTINFIIDAKSPVLFLNCQTLFRIRANIVVENRVDDLRRAVIVANSHLSEVQIERLTEVDSDFSIDIRDNCRLGNLSMLEFTNNASGNINIGSNASIASFYRGGVFRWRDNITINESTDYNLTDYIEGIVRDANGKVINLVCNKEL